jgi:hypothetical protein
VKSAGPGTGSEFIVTLPRLADRPAAAEMLSARNSDPGRDARHQDRSC